MKVLIADDHDLFRDSIAALIREFDPSIDVVLASNLGVAMYHIDSRSKFDVIVLDLCMPSMNGLKGAQDVKQKVKDIPIVLMSGAERNTLGSKAKALGLQGFLPKTMSGKSVVHALKLIAEGEDFFSKSGAYRTLDNTPNSLTLPDWSFV